MPFYTFIVEVLLPRQRVMKRIRSLVREQPSFWQLFTEKLKPRDNTLPPFIGWADNDSFRMHRDIRYRNSFLPLIRGEALTTPTGTEIDVIMFMHPLAAVFMTLWLGMTVRVALTGATPILTAMFLFGVVALGAFFWKPSKRSEYWLTPSLILESPRRRQGRGRDGGVTNE